MKDLNDYHRTRRFQTTLANFHSYCQRQSQESSIITDNRSKSSSDIGNYKNIRQLRKKGENKSQILQNHSKKPPQQGSNEQTFSIRNADLIEIIKLKLNNDKFGTKVEDSGYKNYKKRSFNQKHYGYYQFCNLTSKNINAVKGKRTRIDLIISNSKLKPSQNPKSKRQQKISQLIVTLHHRPYSAVEKSATNRGIENSNLSKEKYKSREKPKRNEIIHKKQKSDLPKNDQFDQIVKEISGWDLPQQQDEVFFNQDPKRKRTKMTKR